MLFIEDFTEGRPWVAPAPIGYVERGWAGIVEDLLDDIGRAVQAHPEAVVDIVDVSERDGRLQFVCLIEGGEEPKPGISAAVEAAVAAAALRSSRACRRCGRASCGTAAVRSGRRCPRARPLGTGPDCTGPSCVRVARKRLNARRSLIIFRVVWIMEPH